MGFGSWTGDFFSDLLCRDGDFDECDAPCLTAGRNNLYITPALHWQALSRSLTWRVVAVGKYEAAVWQ
jgi:hypothetical protein